MSTLLTCLRLATALACSITLSLLVQGAGSVASALAADWRPAGSEGPAATVQAPGLPQPLEIVGQVGGYVTTVAVEGTRAYVATGPRIVIWDLAEAARPVRLGQTDPLPGTIEFLEVHAGHAYLTGRFRGLLVVDLTDPARPRQLPTVDIPPTWTASMLTHGARLLLALDGVGLYIFDLAQPAMPRFVGKVDPPERLGRAMAVDGNRLYLSSLVQSGTEILILDLSNPAAVVRLGTLAFDLGVTDIALRGNLAYVAMTDGGRTSKIEVLDVTDPACIEVRGEVEVIGAVYHQQVTDRALILGIDATYWGRVVVLDLAVPTAPSEVAVLTTRRAVVRLAAMNNLVLAASGRGGLHMYAMDDLEGPHIVGRMPAPPSASRLVSDHDILYVLGTEQVPRLIDVRDPSKPRELALLHTKGEARDLEVDGETAYIATAYGLEVFDISSPSEPKPLGSLSVNRSQWSLALAGESLLALWGGDAALRLVDVSDPALPRLVSSLTIPNPEGVVRSGRYLYVTTFQDGLIVLDVAAPASPLVVGQVSLPGVAMDIVVSNGIVFVACPLGGAESIWIGDLAEPTRPRRIGAINLPYNSRLGLSGDVLFVSGATRREDRMPFSAFDVSTPSTPRYIGGLDHSESIDGMAVSGDKVFLLANPDDADHASTLLVVDVSDPVSPPEPAVFAVPTTPREVARVGPLALVSESEGGAAVMDGFDPTLVREVPGLADQWVQDIEVQGNTAYLYPRNLGALYLFDVLSPLEPRLVASLALPQAIDLKVLGTLVFVLEADALRIIDLSDPAAPQALGAVEIKLSAVGEVPPYLYGLALAGDHAYVVGNVGVLVLDVSNPRRPSRIGGLLDAKVGGRAIDVRGSHAFIVGEGGLKVVDVGHPEAPRFTGAAGGQSMAVLGQEDLIYVVGDDGLRVFDLSPEGRPRSLGSLRIPGNPRALALHDGKVYVAAEAGGLAVVQVDVERLRWPRISLPWLGGGAGGAGAQGGVAALER